MSMSMMMIQGQPIEVTIVCCSKLKDTEWISRQDPYVCLEYASSKFRTRTCTDGGKNPVFQEKFVFPLIEGLRELNVVVWNSNTLTFDDFIGSGKVQLNKVLSQGFDDSSWPLQSKSGRYAGELKLILHFPNASSSKLNNHQKPGGSSSYMTTPTPTAPPHSYYHQQQQQPSPYYHHPTPPPPIANAYPPVPPATANSPYPPPYSYPPSSAYPPQPYPPPHSYPPSSAYPPPSYPPPAGYPPQTHGGIYPPPPY